MGQQPIFSDKNILVGASNADDAGVYRITDDIATVLTVDFFTPIVDDPYEFGAIAAANSLSDIYAMGSKPLVALNVAMFPADAELFPMLKQIIQGGIDKMTEAGVSIIGGHTIRDKEPKFGYVVMGVIHPEKIYDNAKAKPGDALVLTKPIGTGIISTGVRAGVCDETSQREFTESMLALNKKAGEIMIEVGVSTATDITGFGLIGHLNEVLSASRCSACLSVSQVPFFTKAVSFAEQNIVPGGTYDNFTNYSQFVRWDKNVSYAEKLLLNDAQTSGGLLIFVPSEKKEQLISSLRKEGVLASYIGDIHQEEPDSKVRISVER